MRISIAQITSRRLLLRSPITRFLFCFRTPQSFIERPPLLISTSCLPGIRMVGKSVCPARFRLLLILCFHGIWLLDVGSIVT